MMNYRTLTNEELVRLAKDDFRFQRDALFTELVLRTETPDHARNTQHAKPELIDARR